MIRRLFLISFITLIASKNLLAKSDYFQKGMVLFDQNKFEDAKFKFEQDIVQNPKSELSYLYLSKIFNKLNKKELEEQNLDTVILLNPKNEEAIYYLAKLKLHNSDYKKSKELNSRLKHVCNKLCSESDQLKI